MAQQFLNIGLAPNDKTGDSLRDGGDKINDNFTELYASVEAADEKASQSEAEAGTDNSKAMTALRVKQALPAVPIAATGGTALRSTADRWGDIVNVLDFVEGTDTGAQQFINRAAAAALTRGYRTLYIPEKALAYTTTGAITLPANVAVYADEGALIKPASNAVTVLLDTPETLAGTDQHNNGLIRGGIWDCDEKALSAFKLRYFANMRVVDLKILGNKGKAIELGSNTAPSSSYGAFIDDVLIRRDAYTAYTAGASGIYSTNSGDNHFGGRGITIMGQERGIDGTYWDTKIDKVHVWSTPNNGSVIDCFRNYGGQAIFSQCQADGPISGSAFNLQGDATLLGCSTNMPAAAGGWGTDNTAYCVTIGTGKAVSAFGCTFKGDATARWKADFSGDLSNLIAVGGQCSNVMTINGGKWTAYTPSITASSGTITSASATGAYQRSGREGKTIDFRIRATITTNGTGAGNIVISLPGGWTPTDVCLFVGKEIATSFLPLYGQISGTNINVYTMGNAYPAANGSVILMNGRYEIQ